MYIIYRGTWRLEQPLVHHKKVDEPRGLVHKVKEKNTIYYFRDGKLNANTWTSEEQFWTASLN